MELLMEVDQMVDIIIIMVQILIIMTQVEVTILQHIQLMLQLLH